ncbi:MAG: VCBS repeat-containing protein [Myxococcales bacterium]|nr:VCBS repeat-containing protein [Myxococcales bacterium]
MRSFLLSALLLLSCEAFTTANPDYCSDVRPCADSNSECDMDKHICIDKRTPRIDKISPFAVSRNGNVEINLRGKGFARVDKVTIAGIDAQIKMASENEITILTPAVSGACGLTEVVIHTLDNLTTSNNKILRLRANDIKFSVDTNNGALDPKIEMMVGVKFDALNNNGIILLNDKNAPAVNYAFAKENNTFISGYVGNSRTPIPLNKIMAAHFIANSPLDVLAIDQSMNYRLWTYSKPGQMQPYDFKELEPAAQVPHSDAAVGNFDGNAEMLDRLAFLNQMNNKPTVTVYKFGTKGEFELIGEIPIRTIGKVTSMIAGDLTGDGIADIVLTDNATGTIMIIKNKITESSILISEILTNTNNQAQIVDVNLDGRPDVVTYGSGTTSGGSIVIYYNRGSDIFEKYIVPTDVISTRHLAIADFDCDGLSDFITYNGMSINWNSNQGDGFSSDRLSNPMKFNPIKSMTVGRYSDVGNPTPAFALGESATPTQYSLALLLTEPQ